MIIAKEDSLSVDLVAEKLKLGEIVIIPTDTVYGFSGIVDSSSFTDEKIRKIKGRDENKPLIQLIAFPEDIYKYTNDKIPEKVFSSWPGALTVIVNDVRGGTTAFRCPGDEWLRKIIEKVDFPLFSTSVNKSGLPVLEKIDEIVETFQDDVSIIVSDGDKPNALPSTLVKIDGENISVLRQGSVKI